MNEAEKADRERMAEQKEADELSRMGAVAAEEQAERLEANRALVADYERLESRRAELSRAFADHQKRVYDGQEGTMTEAEMRLNTDSLDTIGLRMRAFESKYPDLKHSRYLMTAPDLVEAGIAKPDGKVPLDAAGTDGVQLDAYLKSRYGFDAEAAEKDEPSRPTTVPVGMGSTEDPDRQTTEVPERTVEELRANEEAARKVVEAQKPQLGFDPKHLEHFAKPVEVLNPIVEARRTMREAFDADPDFFETYVANVAMLLHDRWDITDHDDRNRAAREVLDLIFWDRR